MTRALQQIAASFGVAILGSILSNVYQSQLTAHLATLPFGLDAPALGSVAAAHAIAAHLPAAAGSALIRAANDAYTQGLATVMLVSAASVIVAAILIAIFLPSRITKIDPKELT